MQLSYSEAVSVLENALTFGINPSLEPIHKMCDAMGNPQKTYSCIQITGTNGKSSTTRMIAALLRAQGIHVGLYVSPHLVKYPERIEIDGEVVSDELFAQAISAAIDAADAAGIEVTEFEILTSAAFWLFAQESVEWAILECGMGGRWDATSAIDPKVAVITGVALEHTEILGDTIEKIAGEKAAIIKSGSLAVFAHDLKARDVFEDRACSVGAPFSYANPEDIAEYSESLSHLPEYQRSNAATALCAANAALGQELSHDAVSAAFEGVVIPGRFETLYADPLVIIDAAHNPQSAETLAAEIGRRFGLADRPALLLGVLADKDARGVVRALCPLFSRVVVTASSSPRSTSASELAQIVEAETGIKPEIATTVADARRLLAGEAVIATGSITVAGEVKAIW